MNLKISLLLPATGLLAGLLASSPTAMAADRFHLEPALPSQTAPGATTNVISSGGNVAQYPNAGGSVPHDSGNRFFLAESSISYCGPTSEGGMNTRADLNAAAVGPLAAGTIYKNSSVPGNWQIVFNGVVDVSTGLQAQGGTNFHPEKISQSLDYYRAVALAFPNDLQAKINFINSLRDLMVPYSYAGNSSFARAAKERVLNGPADIPTVPGQEQGNPTATDREDGMLGNAYGMYDLAISPFVELMGAADSFQVAFPGTLPAGMTEDTQIVKDFRNAQKLLCSAYARATGSKGETILRSYQLRYFKSYSVPTLSTPIPLAVKTLLTGLDAETQGLDYNLLITSPLQGNSWFPAAEFAPARGFLGNALDLRTSMSNGLLTFSGLDSSLNIKANAYEGDYVPFFFDPTVLATPSTFTGLIAAAKPLVTASEAADANAVSSIGQLDLNLQSLAQRLNDLNEQYNSQLGQLCGWKMGMVNGLPTRVPDIDGAIVPPEQRPAWRERDVLDRGDIGMQWLEIDAAEQAMEKALLDLENVLAAIDKKRETWQLIKGSREEMIQNVILSTGQKMAQLEKDAAEARAKFSEYQAKLAKKKKKRGLFSGFIGTALAVIAAPYTGGASLFATAAWTGTNIAIGAATAALNLAETANQYSAAGLEVKAFKSQADLDRQLGEIASKKEELAYLEKAGMQFQQIDEEGYRVEEAIHSLLLEVKSAELQIEMADLRVDREYTKLSTMLNRVSYLTQQQASSLSLANTNPLNSPDFRITRDRNVREAEERFIFAQEWAFLTGRAAGYIALGSTRKASIEAINAEILKARTGKRLNYLLDRLQTEWNLVTADLGARASQKITISLRDMIAQHNLVSRTANGTVTNSAASLLEAQQYVNSEGVTVFGNSLAISDAAWLEFLRNHFVFPVGPELLKLEIPFRLTLEQWANRDRPTSLPRNQNTREAPLVQNPLFNATRKGAVIFYDKNAPEYFGVRVDILGNLDDIPNSSAISVNLSPEGASYIRNQAYTADPTGRSTQVYQLGSNKAQASIEASINGVPATNRNAQLHERSPANDKWTLTIHHADGPNRALLENLEKIRDIRVTFSLSSY